MRPPPPPYLSPSPQASPASAAGRHRVMFVSDASGESPASRMVKRLVRREPDSIQTPSPLPARPGGLSYRGVLKSGAATPEKPAATGVKMKAGIGEEGGLEDLSGLGC